MEQKSNVLPEVVNLIKENVMLSNTLLRTANQLEEWASQSLRGDWSQHQVKPMKQAATNIRHEVRGTKFFRKENDND